jgi:DNA helicase-2/ATP-dependent DNA helicase PcrA
VRWPRGCGWPRRCSLTGCPNRRWTRATARSPLWTYETPLALRCGDDLERFLVEVETGAEVDALDPRAHAVTLLTMHAAKGLEYPVVFLVGVEDGLLPLRPAGPAPLDEATSAEERRVFFVGLTRAQDRLFLSYARRRYRHGAERDARPSPFLDAVDPGLFERRGGDVPRRPRDRQLRLI